MKALDEKRYPDAVPGFRRKPIAADPKDYSLHFNLALAYSLMGKNAEAIPEYKKTLELKPDLYQADLNLGISLLRETARRSGAVFDCRGKPKAEGISAQLLSGSGAAGHGRFRQSRAGLHGRARAIDPKSPDAELGLAHALAEAEQAGRRGSSFQESRRAESQLSRRSAGAGSHVRDGEAAGASHRDLPAVPRESRARRSGWAICCSRPAQPADAIPLSKLRSRNRPPKPIARRWPKRTSRTTSRQSAAAGGTDSGRRSRTISRSACCMDA